MNPSGFRAAACHAHFMEGEQLAASGRLIIVCGLPGAGKTTLARQLEREYAAMRLCPDEWMADLGFDLFDEGARERIEQVQWRLAQRLLQLGDIVIIEWGSWDRAERSVLRQRARELGAAVELRFLDEPLEVLWARVHAARAFIGDAGVTRRDTARVQGVVANTSLLQ